MTNTLTGSCLCGQVAFTIDGGLEMAGHCHCSMCRRWHGAPCGSYAKVIDPASFKFTAGQDQYKIYASSEKGRRGFCGNCGSSLTGEEDGRVTWITLTAIHGDPGVQPMAHIYVGSKASWETINDGLPQFEEYPQ